MKYIFANWKSNKNIVGAKEWLDSVGSINSDKEVVLTPPFTILGAIYTQALSSNFKLGVQDISPFSAGSYTGAISPVNLEEMSVSYAIVGHSERRHYFGESDQMVANKVDIALEAKITPVVCVDEGYIESQANAIDSDLRKKCIVAYEPISAIGTGDEMGEKKVGEVVERIKKAFGEVRVIYGGSVDGDNIEEYLEICDGVLIGGASLKVEDFKQLL
jgi:triosephosphate isomerase (TIM)